MEEQERHDIPGQGEPVVDDKSDKQENVEAVAEVIVDAVDVVPVETESVDDGGEATGESMDAVQLEAEVEPETPASEDSAEASDSIDDQLDEDDDEELLLDPKEILKRARAEAEREAAGDAGVASETPDERSWFVIHCYSGYEKKVKHSIEQRIETMGMADQIFEVVVPTEDEIEVKEGKRRTVERRVFPGYILVQMLMNDDSWYVVRNTPGVTGFVGMGNKPTALRQEEVVNIIKRMEAEAPKVKVTFKPGQKVRIIDGPFNDFLGIVDEIDMDRAKARVMVSFFGRDTPVEIDFLQVEKV